MDFLAELWRFMRIRKKFWLLPIILCLVALVTTLALHESFLPFYLSLTAAAVLFVGAIVWQNAWPVIDYTLVLKTSSGDLQVLQTDDKALVSKVKDALERAFSYRT